jgi:hypothetical protein
LLRISSRSWLEPVLLLTLHFLSYQIHSTFQIFSDLFSISLHFSQNSTDVFRILGPRLPRRSTSLSISSLRLQRKCSHYALPSKQKLGTSREICMYIFIIFIFITYNNKYLYQYLCVYGVYLPLHYISLPYEYLALPYYVSNDVT